MKNNKKEDKLNDQLKKPNNDHSLQIEKLIDDTLKKGHKVFLCTDWHLWIRKEKGSTECHKRKEFEEIIKNVNDTMTKDDVLINLGDLVDGEFKDKDELKSIIKTLPGHKILTIGNNDIFPVSFYKSCGFEYVTQSFIWHNVIFSHMPIKNDNDVNVHGHIHKSMCYWVPYKNHIDVAYLDGRIKLVPLQDAIDAQPKYSKLIKEDPSHFDESFSFFEYTMITADGFMPDPFRDEYM